MPSKIGGGGSWEADDSIWKRNRSSSITLPFPELLLKGDGVQRHCDCTFEANSFTPRPYLPSAERCFRVTSSVVGHF